MITGESFPIRKEPGKSVIGGTINQNGSLLIRVSEVGMNSSLYQIIVLVQNAQTNKVVLIRCFLLDVIIRHLSSCFLIRLLPTLSLQ